MTKKTIFEIYSRGPTRGVAVSQNKGSPDIQRLPEMLLTMILNHRRSKKLRKVT